MNGFAAADLSAERVEMRREGRSRGIVRAMERDGGEAARAKSVGAEESEGGAERFVLFVDACDSTEIFEREGDRRGRHLIEGFMTDCAAAADRAGGRVVKRTGDGLMCTFESADAALAAGVAMREAVAAGGLDLRVGFHVGPAIWSQGDYYGDAVNVAARVAGFAKPGEILFTGQAAARLSALARRGIRLVDRVVPRGRSAAVDIYGLAPLEADDTLLTRPATLALGEERRLVLRAGGRRLEMAPGGGKLILGRDADCDLALAGDFVSRRHARIEAVSRGYDLVDQSTNGTYVELSDTTRLRLKRERYRLVGSGRFSLGRPPERNIGNVVDFEVISSRE